MADDTQKGRPTNLSRIKDGKLIVSKSCKVCKSLVRDEITQCLLRGIAGSKIIAEYGHHFDPPLTPTNLHSHKQHINPEIAVKEDRKKAVATSMDYDPTTKELYRHKYDESFDKAKAADDLYRKRLDNLFYLQKEIETLNKTERESENNELSVADANLRRKMIQDLEFAYKGFNQDLIKHIALDADLYVKQVNIQFIKMIQRAFIIFTRKFMDVLVKEIEDPVIRERLKEQLGDLLDTEVSPVLDPNKAIGAEYEVIEDDTKKS